MQVPSAPPVTVLPVIVHTLRVVLLKVTELPEAPPVALTVAVAPTASVGAVPKTMA